MTLEVVTFEAVKPAGPRLCRCVAVHSPSQLPDEAEAHHKWPKSYGGPDIPSNLVYLCPTSHTKVHNLWRAWVKVSGEPPWAIMRHYSGYLRGITAEGWYQVESAGRVHAVRAMMSANEQDRSEHT